MFSGIVEACGQVVALEREGENLHLTLSCPFAHELKIDQSVAHNGVCLTVVAHDEHTYTVTAIQETLDRSNLGKLSIGDRVNLERSMLLGGRLDGHIVQGHVDATAEVLDHHRGEHWDLLRISLPQEIARYVAVKGSVALDGVSLTVVDVVDASDVAPVPGAGASLSVGLIPETLRRTTLGTRRPGERVNLEVDVLAKYAERLLGARMSQEEQRAC